MKKKLNFIEWIKSPKSDFLLFIIILVLVNIAFHNAHLRFDVTAQGTYSLSEASKNTVRTLHEPLTVNVFFSKDLPSTYNNVYQYIKDILVEYKGVGNKNFTYNLFDMGKEGNQRIATSYGLRQVQVQEVKNNEVKLKQVWMGLAISYGDAIETLDSVTTESGFEYNLTTKINKVISTSDTLAALGENERVNLYLYASEELGQFGISGFDTLDSTVNSAFNAVNKKAYGRLFYQKISVKESDVPGYVDKYGLQPLNWKKEDNTQGVAIFGLVLQYKADFRVLPLTIRQNPLMAIFGGNGLEVAGLDDLEDNINKNLQGLLSRVNEIGYITGHDELALSDEQGANIHLVTLLSDMYELKKIDLTKEEIPGNLYSIIIAGAKKEFSEKELYKIDQFIMRGGNLLLFNDPFDVAGGGYQQQTFTPIENGLDKILTTYGIKLPSSYVFDENCYIARQQTGYGIENFNLYYAPMLSARQLNQRHPITKNLGYVIFLQQGALNVEEAKKDKNLKVTTLATTSDSAWTQSQGIQLLPNIGLPYDKSTMKKEDLAVLIEGKFKSAFDKRPESMDKEEESDKEKDENAEGEKDKRAENKTPSNDNSNSVTTTSHITQGRQKAKLFITGSSLIASNQLLDESGREPISLFIRNVIDYFNGNEDLCSMRTKGVSFNTLKITTGALPAFIEYFCMIGIAVIVLIISLVVYYKRVARKKRIHSIYNPNDSRVAK